MSGAQHPDAAATLIEWLRESFVPTEPTGSLAAQQSQAVLMPLQGLPEARLRLRQDYRCANLREFELLLRNTTFFTRLPQVAVPTPGAHLAHLAHARDRLTFNTADGPWHRSDPVLAFTPYCEGEDLGQWHARLDNRRPARKFGKPDKQDKVANALEILSILNRAEDALFIEFFQSNRALLAEGYPVDVRGANTLFHLHSQADRPDVILPPIVQIDNGMPLEVSASAFLPQHAKYAHVEKFLDFAFLRLGIWNQKSTPELVQARDEAWGEFKAKIRRCASAAHYPLTSQEAEDILAAAPKARIPHATDPDVIDPRAPGSARQAYESLTAMIEAERAKLPQAVKGVA